MKPIEARDLADEELHDKLSDLREELFNLRFQSATGQLDNHRRLRLVRRDIARLRTVLREREFEAFERTGESGATDDASSAGSEEQTS